MNLVKIGPNYYNIDHLACIQPDLVNNTPSYALFFTGVIGPLEVTDQAEILALDVFIEANGRPLAPERPQS
jgi:hypothetical protein